MLEAVTTQRLYNLILEIIAMLELELAELKKTGISKSNKKNITETLHKLVCLLIQLSKLRNNKGEIIDNVSDDLTDKEIIKQFLHNYNLSKNNLMNET